MLEFFSNMSEDNAIRILKKDHEKVKDLFNQFEDESDHRRKMKIAAEAIMELKIHATIEEEIFYPTVRGRIDELDIMNEADEEHHVAKLLIAELSAMKGTEEHYDAKFIVLSENIRHHIREEEGEMFPRVRSLDLDLDILGRKMLARKIELKRDGVPASDEDKLMARGGVKADSPAKNAAKGSTKPAKAKSAQPRRSAIKEVTKKTEASKRKHA